MPYTKISVKRELKIKSKIAKDLNDEKLIQFEKLLKLDTTSKNFIKEFRALRKNNNFIKKLCSPRVKFGYFFKTNKYKIQRYKTIVDQLKTGLDLSKKTYFPPQIKDSLCAKINTTINELKFNSYKDSLQAAESCKQLNQLQQFNENLEYESTQSIPSKYNRLLSSVEKQLITDDPESNLIVFGLDNEVDINGKSIEESHKNLSPNLKALILKTRMNSDKLNEINMNLSNDQRINDNELFFAIDELNKINDSELPKLYKKKSTELKHSCVIFKKNNEYLYAPYTYRKVTLFN